MVLDYPGVWISTHNMLEQMVLRRSIITTLLEHMEGIDPEMVEVTNDQWKVMEDLVAVLEPFKVTTMTLSEEKIPQISLLKPLLWQLVSSHLKVQESDGETAKTFKESLSDMLCERYADCNVTLLLQIATTLDPRYIKPKKSLETRSLHAMNGFKSYIVYFCYAGLNQCRTSPRRIKARLAFP